MHEPKPLLEQKKISSTEDGGATQLNPIYKQTQPRITITMSLKIALSSKHKLGAIHNQSCGSMRVAELTFVGVASHFQPCLMSHLAESGSCITAHTHTR